MINLGEIIKQNQNTYYDFATTRPLLAWPRYALMLTVSAFFAWMFPNLNKDFANAVITVYAILIGFSFNVLFYLLSTNKMKIQQNKDMLERQNKIERLNKIADELFYNVSYFNLLSVCVVVISLSFFIFDSRLTHIVEDICKIDWAKAYRQIIDSAFCWLRLTFACLYRVCLYYFIVDSLYSFIRIVSRLTYYFRRKISLQNEMGFD